MKIAVKLCKMHKTKKIINEPEDFKKRHNQKIRINLPKKFT